MCDRQARIVGIGTDMCTVSRIAKAIEKEHFYQSVYLDGERAYLAAKGRGKAESAAAMFAAVGAVWAALKPAKITRAAADVLYLFIR